MKILFISELYPLPNRGGEFIRTYGLFRLLQKSGHEIFSILGNTFIGFSLEDNTSKDIIQFDFSRHYNSKSPIKDALLKFKRQDDLIALLNSTLEKFTPDIVFWDYYYYGQYINFFKKKGIKVIYGTHNIQSNLILDYPSRSIKSKISKYLVFILLRYHELKYLKRSNALIAVSEIDKKFYVKKFRKLKVYSIPNFLVEEDYDVPDLNRENYIIMTGNFGAYQNLEGIKWFLRNVWNSNLSSRTRLRIAGRYSDLVYKEMNIGDNYENIEAIGEVDDMKPYIARARAAIVPLLHGSGTRLKCLESMALKTQLISTSLGAEGIEHGGGICIADNAVEFRNNIISILENRFNTTEIAYKSFLSKYSLNANIKIFNRIIEDLAV